LDWNSGAKDDHIVALTVRPSALLRQLLSPLGALARPIVISFFVIAAILFAVELMAGISSLQLARTVTRSVHDLYVGTKKVEAGDFSHRIPVRSKDQLSELANAFNSMTGRVERLIAEVKEKEKLQAELEIARQVQAQFFPKRIPALRTLELLGFCKPARVVSGDYYDFIPFDSRSTALVIGDISGKGISAALLMASVQSSLHAQLKMRSNGLVSTATLVARLNQQLYESTPPEKYATVYCSFYDDESGRLSYTNAGHLAPMVVRRGNIVRLESNGMAVGLFPNFSYEENVIALEPGDLLTAFTDGITESENAAGEQFGEMRLADLLVRHCDRPLDEIVRLITEDVRNWVHDVDNQDDTTMLLARRV
jgi:sigma-B regulation protein RsbU (phosphoserine phosphatase)